MNVYTVGLSVMVYDAYISLNLNIKEATLKKKKKKKDWSSLKSFVKQVTSHHFTE